MSNSNVKNSTFNDSNFIEAASFLERLSEKQLYILNREYIRRKLNSEPVIQEALTESAEEANNYLSFVCDTSHSTRAIALSLILVNKNPITRAFMKELLKPLSMEFIVPDLECDYRVEVDESNFNLISNHLLLISDNLKNTRITCVFKGSNPNLKRRVESMKF